MKDEYITTEKTNIIILLLKEIYDLVDVIVDDMYGAYKLYRKNRVILSKSEFRDIFVKLIEIISNDIRDIKYYDTSITKKTKTADIFDLYVEVMKRELKQVEGISFEIYNEYNNVKKVNVRQYKKYITATEFLLQHSSELLLYIASMYGQE